MQREYAGRIRRCEVGTDGLIEFGGIRAESRGQHGEELEPTFRRQCLETLENLAREGNTREFAQFGMQGLAGFRQRLQLTAVPQCTAAGGETIPNTGERAARPFGYGLKISFRLLRRRI